MSQLPPGFVFEDELPAPTAPAGAPALPPGFQFEDEAPATPQAAQDGGWYADSMLGKLSIIKPLQAAYEAARSLGQEAMEGRLDPTSESAAGRAFEAAGALGPMSPGRLVTQGYKSAIPGLDPRGAAARAADPTTRLGARTAAAAEQEAARQAARDATRGTIQAAENQGIPLPRAAVLPSFAQRIAAGISEVPILGAPLQNATERTFTRAQERVGDVASGLGTPDVAFAGTGVREGVQNFKGTTMRALDDDAYRAVNEAMPPQTIFTPVESALTLGRISREIADSGGALSGEAARVAALIRRGNVSFKGLQQARSRLGMEMDNAFDAAGYNNDASRALYGALSRDLDNFVGETGGGALQTTWREANRQAQATRDMLGTVRQFGNMQNENSVFENAFQLAMDRRGSQSRLSNLRTVVGEDAWRNVGATAIDRMGRGNNGQFSMTNFVSNFDKMNASSRNTLFGDAAPAVQELAQAFRGMQGLDRFRSTSRSGNVGAVMGLGAGGATGLLTAPISTAIGAATTFVAANALARPVTVRQLAQISRTAQILAKRPSPGIIKQLDQQSKRLGVMLAKDVEPQVANDVVQSLMSAGREMIGPPKSAAASGGLQEQN